MPRSLLLLLALTFTLTLLPPVPPISALPYTFTRTTTPIAARPVPSGTPDSLVNVPQSALPMIPSWIRQFGSDAIDFPAGVGVDSAGNSYIVGTTYGALPGQINAGGDDILLRSYDSTGTERWTHQFGTSAEDATTGMAVDSQGTSYVAGYTYGTLSGTTNTGARDTFLRIYDSTGAEIWTRQFGSPDDDWAMGITVDPTGNSYIISSTAGALPGQTNSGDTDLFLRKYDSTGTEEWTRQFGTPSNDFAFGVTADSQSKIYVIGDTVGTFPGQTSAGWVDAFLIKFEELTVTATVALPLTTRQSPPGW